MGNAESKDGASGPPATSPGSNNTHKPQRTGSRRLSKKPSLPTEAWVTSSSSDPPSTSQYYAHGATVSASPKRAAHARARSITASQSNHHRAVDDLAHSHRSALSAISAMGQADSKARPPSRSNTLPIHASPPRPPTPPSQPQEATPAPVTESPEPTESQPVDVPPANHVGGEDAIPDDYIPTGYSASPYGLPPANYSRPPRLPLPIEEEVHTPGSPIITPQDITAIKDDDIEEGAIPRIASVRSSTTVDDDDVGDNDAYDTSGLNNGSVKVSYKFAWNGSGEKVFVTGTFCNWDKKIKVPRNKDGAPGFSARLYLPPGTHHCKFLVDGEMVTSPDLPTTVDWTNILVNYIEVVAPLPEGQTQPPEAAQPIDIPGTTVPADDVTGKQEAAVRALADSAQPSDNEANVPSPLQATDGSTKSEKQPTEVSASIPIPSTPAPRQIEPQTEPETKPKPAPKQTIPRAKYTNTIPQFLVDLDNYQNPEDERYQRAQRVTNTLPQPPSLPMFLNKSILNGATPHKDDASVLIMPNHTVLNHLATSSIRSGVLATSGTTRYKRKFLTTIMYKPTSEDT
ncbi:hypothetical protein CKM354_001027300 [Cercospora kikuchii]|uniref:Association with the SNF1 complex (ASC) domain-containing protein n=1 Tax=Cercospora kikuchii TaxID=84275 RepID=A0A9P3FKI4_9PEZI|nr:uncharacterized protein CKM354_001027300 [Cercospora kikuchii]GIZ47174.1 hypothetical protein CKM354_001027300 [Cercospora kikuchii]